MNKDVIWIKINRQTNKRRSNRPAHRRPDQHQTKIRPPTPEQKKANRNSIIIIIVIVLLVLLAIIAIATSMILVSLGSARTKARLASGQAMLNTVPAAMVQCIDFNSSILPPIEGQNICSNTQDVSALWPELPEGWQYEQVQNNNNKQVSLTASCDSASCGKEITYTCTLMGCH